MDSTAFPQQPYDVPPIGSHSYYCPRKDCGELASLVQDSSSEEAREKIRVNGWRPKPNQTHFGNTIPARVFCIYKCKCNRTFGVYFLPPELQDWSTTFSSLGLCPKKHCGEIANAIKDYRDPAKPQSDIRVFGYKPHHYRRDAREAGIANPTLLFREYCCFGNHVFGMYLSYHPDSGSHHTSGVGVNKDASSRDLVLQDVESNIYTDWESMYIGREGLWNPLTNVGQPQPHHGIHNHAAENSTPALAPNRTQIGSTNQQSPQASSPIFSHGRTKSFSRTVSSRTRTIPGPSGDQTERPLGYEKWMTHLFRKFQKPEYGEIKPCAECKRKSKRTSISCQDCNTIRKIIIARHPVVLDHLRACPDPGRLWRDVSFQDREKFFALI